MSNQNSGGKNRVMWDIGNTTVRNPERLYDALRVFADKIADRVFDLSAQEEFWVELKAAGLIESSTEKERASQGRKFFAALYQLGFVHREGLRVGRVSLTEVGKIYLANPNLEEQIFLRQLLKYKVSSPIEPQRFLDTRPFLVILRLLYMTHQAGMGGLTKDEIAAFVVNLLKDDEDSIQESFKAIQIFRSRYSKLKGKVLKRNLAHEVLQKRTPKQRKPETLIDYADSSMRYARMSGLITLEATGGRFILAPSKLELVEWILDNPPAKIPDKDYVSVLHNPTTPPLPTDNATIANRQIQKLQKEYERLARSAGKEVGRLSEIGERIIDKQSGIRNLEKQIAELREFDFYRKQRSSGALIEIKQLLQNILTNELPLSQRYAPAFLEWALWRLLLAINEIRNPISETRGFKVDDELVPLHHAVPNIADCKFIYDDFILLVEVTLTRSHRQVEAEVFPVLNHAARTMFEFPDKVVYCLFVAPKIDSNVFRRFYEGIYDLGEVEYKTNVVPLTISEVLNLIDSMIRKKKILDNIEFRKILQSILNLREKYRTGKEWGKNYPTYFAEYIARI